MRTPEAAITAEDIVKAIPNKKMVVGYGAGAIADYPWHLSGEKPWTEEDDIRGRKTLNQLVDSDISLIDTAHRYGNGRSERLIGDFLQAIPKPLADRFFVVTKIGLQDSTHAMYADLNESIRRLRRMPQAVLLHNPDMGKKSDMENACEWMAQDVKSMGITFTGISSEPTPELEYYFGKYRFNVIQFPFSFRDPRAHTAIFPWVNRRQWILKIANRVMGGPDRYSVPDALGCLKYIVDHKSYVDVVLTGTTKPEHIAENAKIVRELQEKGQSHA